MQELAQDIELNLEPFDLRFQLLDAEIGQLSCFSGRQPCLNQKIISKISMAQENSQKLWVENYLEGVVSLNLWKAVPPLIIPGRDLNLPHVQHHIGLVQKPVK